MTVPPSRRHGVTPLPADAVFELLAGVRAGMEGRGLTEAEALVDRAEGLARAGKVAQAAELLREAAEGLTARKRKLSD